MPISETDSPSQLERPEASNVTDLLCGKAPAVPASADQDGEKGTQLRKMILPQELLRKA